MRAADDTVLPPPAAVDGCGPPPAPRRTAPPGDGAGGPGTGGEVVHHPVDSEEDLVRLRHAVRAATLRAEFSLVDQTRVVTAASELARNAFVHAGGGTVAIEVLRHTDRRGLRLTVTDQGPGISDLDAAFTDGYTTGGGLGHGLGGARRLMPDFHVRTAEREGTTVIATRWVSP
ncbi:ATP-binding protein [Streptomyces lavendofoliae]|uniref:ATP-binding protein n=1 Tax=Streptomyces lavendofoliae TaxID=67314 RepID=UPI003D8DA8EB